MPNHANKKQAGVAIILTILSISLVLFLAIYILNVAMSEKLISDSQINGVKTYYLAEAGINEMIWLIKNDSEFKNNFETNATWSTSTTRVNPFGLSTGSYTVTITNSSAAHAEIISTGYIDTGHGNIAQRVVKTYVYKATGQSVVGDSAAYGDGNIDISNSLVNFYNGSAHSNNTFTVNSSSIINVDSDLNAAGNYIEHWSSTANITGDIHAANYPPAASEIDMPAVDFNSASSSSLLNQATKVYTSSEFEDWLDQQYPTAVLTDDITYVTGDINLDGGITLKSPPSGGLLVAERDFSIGFKQNWNGHSGDSSVNFTHASGTPSGIIAGRHVDIKSHTANVDIEGVIYANDLLNINNLNPAIASFNIEGGLIARKLTITSSWEAINITHNNAILIEALGPASTSPTIIVEHWEEEY